MESLVSLVERLDWDWIGLDWIGLDWIGIGLDWDWIGLDWIGLGLDWIGIGIESIQQIERSRRLGCLSRQCVSISLR